MDSLRTDGKSDVLTGFLSTVGIKKLVTFHIYKILKIIFFNII